MSASDRDPLNRSQEDEKDALAIWQTFDAFHKVISKTLPYSLMSDDLKSRLASDLTVAFESRRATKATEELIEAVLATRSRNS
jgi:hypothetical protein